MFLCDKSDKKAPTSWLLSSPANAIIKLSRKPPRISTLLCKAAYGGRVHLPCALVVDLIGLGYPKNPARYL